MSHRVTESASGTDHASSPKLLMLRRHLSQIGLKSSDPPSRPEVDVDPMGYPRPQFRRDDWITLNGTWQFAMDAEEEASNPGDVAWASEILVPFAPETFASGIADTGLYRACWYRTSFEGPPLADGARLIIHFGAVDYCATVWVDGAFAVRHEGGYTPFEVDVTDMLVEGVAAHDIVVLASDDPGDLSKPRGKQDWQLEPHSIWYPRTTGIWQSVWMERVPPVRVETLQWTANL